LSSRRSQKAICWLEVLTVVASFSMAIGLSEGATNFLKIWVQRRRPSFYDLCGFNTQTLQCEASPDYIKEANLSFPSGHSSLSCCGMTFLVWYFQGKIKTRERWITWAIAVVPWGWSVFVAASRLVDHWHHPSDIVAGLGLGFAAGTLAYHVWYPPIWSPSAGTPRPILDEFDSSGNQKFGSFND
jgi:membrane-associated phospholipid phosphatase